MSALAQLVAHAGEAGADQPAPRTARWFVPGRIEVLGKHTDYAGGRSLLAAVDRGHTITATERTDRTLRVRSTLGDGAAQEVELDLEDPGALDVPAGHWGSYVRTVAERLERNVPGAQRGADITITTTLPLAAGMSSSSALIVGLALAQIDLAGIAADERFARAVTTDEQLAEYLGTVENGQSFGELTGHRGVGTFGGSEDHTAMLCGSDGQLVQYAFHPVRRESSVPFPEHLALVVAVSGIEAHKTGAARGDYNELSSAAAALLERWREDRGGRGDGTVQSSLAQIAALGPGAIMRLRGLVAAEQPLRERWDQFVEESERLVPAAAVALADGDLAELGRLADASQRAADRGLGNQVPQTRALQALAREERAHAASAFGAGFGGSVWALVDRDGAEDFAQRWLQRYVQQFPEAAERASTLVTRPGPAAHRV